MTTEWQQRLWWLLSGAPDASSGNRLLLLALVACSLFACGQLLTMLGTRWGDHHALAKSFFLSVLVHLCLGLGWATVIAEYPVPPAGLSSNNNEPVSVQAVLADSDESISLPEPTPEGVWKNAIRDVPAPQVTRFDRETTAAVEKTVAPRIERPTPVIPPEALSIGTAAIEPQPQPEIAPLTPVVHTPGTPAFTEDPPAGELIARAEAGPVAAMPARQSVPRAAAAETFVDAIPARGSAQRLATERTDLELAIPLPLDDNATAPRPVGGNSDAVARKAGPVSSPVGETQTGAASAVSTPSEPSPFSRSTNNRVASNSAGNSAARPESLTPNRDAARDRMNSVQQSLSQPLDADPQPSVIRSAPAGSQPSAAPTGAATTYRLRRIDSRKEIAIKNGGTEASEQAVEDALTWLAKHQEADGYWDADKHGGGTREVRNTDKDKPTGGGETDTGLTGLAILSFLGSGHTDEEGHYTENVGRAIRWLIAKQRSDGYLGGRATYYDQMYCHAIATYALGEAYGMRSESTEIPGLRDAVSKGVWYITQTQNGDGGWRYRVGSSKSDMSMFGWQLMALKSAELAGLDVPDDVRRGMIRFLRDRSRGDANGLAGYNLDQDYPTPAMTAEALFCKQMYGLKRSSPSSREAVEYLAQNLPRMSHPDEYYWYYGTLSMYQYGGEPWERWNQSLRDTLIRLQRKSGDARGSWDPAGPWGSVGGRVYSTTFCVLSLEVYYRFLPLYKAGEE